MLSVSIVSALTQVWRVRQPGTDTQLQTSRTGAFSDSPVARSAKVSGVGELYLVGLVWLHQARCSCAHNLHRTIARRARWHSATCHHRCTSLPQARAMHGPLFGLQGSSLRLHHILSGHLHPHLRDKGRDRRRGRSHERQPGSLARQADRCERERFAVRRPIQPGISCRKVQPRPATTAVLSDFSGGRIVSDARSIPDSATSRRCSASRSS